MKTLAILSVLSIAATTTLAFAGDPTSKPSAPMKTPVTAAVPVPTAPACFELSPDGKAWSKTPEVMCVDIGDKNVAITLKSGMPPTPTEVAVFHLNVKSRVNCLDCNKDVFALTNPSSSVFNALEISFDGKRDLKAGTESGSVSIGKTKLFYRRLK